MIFIGIDNGTTGTIGFYRNGVGQNYKMPTMQRDGFLQKEKKENRIDFLSLCDFIKNKTQGVPKEMIYLAIERPFQGANSFTSSIANRSFEAQRIAVELSGCDCAVVAASYWQKDLLGSSGKKSKECARELADSLFPERKIKDQDGLLIAYWLFLRANQMGIPFNNHFIKSIQKQIFR